MSDDSFPSGPWVGFYNYGPGARRHRMDLNLEFSAGSMTGDGDDDVGRFLIRGKYDATSRECHWTKTYPGSHDVYYRGFREGKGIWGTWEIGIFAHGGFHIWPKAAEQDETTTAGKEAEAPVDAIAQAEHSPTEIAPAEDVPKGHVSRITRHVSRITLTYLRPPRAPFRTTTESCEPIVN